jgi:putative acetyltransferase
MRAVTEKDFDVVYDIYMDESVNPFMCHGPMSKDSFREIFGGLLKHDYSWLCERDGMICGMCFAWRGKGRIRHVATLLTLGIKAEFQGLGLGREIVSEALRTLEAANILRVDLMAEADNAKAIEFYKKMGFSIDGVLPRYLKREDSDDYIDEILMSKMLD